MSDALSQQSLEICKIDDLVAGSGVAVMLGQNQIALFYLPEETQAIYAVSNFDPFSEANVISRGILGDLQGELVVASPIYKQHFSLETGQCLEDDTVSLSVYQAEITGSSVMLWL